MKRYEYLKIGILNQSAEVTDPKGKTYKIEGGGLFGNIYNATHKHINELGRQGWRLVSIVPAGLGQIFYLERELE
jgi:hypothetical protein